MSEPLPTIGKILLGWLLLSVLTAWTWGRWFRWLRGDFDRDE